MKLFVKLFFLVMIVVLNSCLGKPVAPILGLEQKDVSRPVVHLVKSSEEKLEDLAFWYTGKKDNASIISRYNNLHGKKLSVGDSIVIPEDIVRSRKPYQVKSKNDKTAKAIQKIQNLESEGREAKASEAKMSQGEKIPEKLPKEVGVKNAPKKLPDKIDNQKLDDKRFKYLKELSEF